MAGFVPLLVTVGSADSKDEFLSMFGSLMGQDHKKEIEQIMSQFKCPKDFGCYKSGFKVLCKAKDIRIESFLECGVNPSILPVFTPFRHRAPLRMSRSHLYFQEPKEVSFGIPLRGLGMLC